MIAKAETIDAANDAETGHPLTAAMEESPLPTSIADAVAKHKAARDLANRIVTDEVGAAICHHLANGWSLREVCKMLKVSVPAVCAWALDDRGADHYARARQIQAMGWADEVVEIADNGVNDWMRRNAPDDPGWVANGENFNRSRLRVDTRKWLLSKVLPKVYGDNGESAGRGPLVSFHFNALPTSPAMIDVSATSRPALPAV